MFVSCAVNCYLFLKRPLLSPRTLTALPLPTDTCLRFWISICLLIWYLDMASAKECCVPDCKTTRDCKITMHCFPNPDKDPEKFRQWLFNIGGDVVALNNQYIYKYRRVCHVHFETKYHTWTNRLSPDAIPTLRLKALSLTKRPLLDISNIPSTTEGKIQHPSYASTSVSTIPDAVAGPSNVPHPPLDSKKTSLTNKKTLGALCRKLQKQKLNYATRLKKALKLSENRTFQNCLKKFTTLAALFTVMQFREISKKKLGRRFSQEEKLMALSLYKQGPKAYRWLSKIFILPSPLTLSRLISVASIKPGINKKIFAQIKNRAKKMSEDEKLCILIFDEVAITPHFDYNRRRDLITGFSKKHDLKQRRIADHALVFMIRGVIKNYKQPIAYSFCSGTTGTNDLKMLIKNIVEELHNCGLKVVATVCDQGSTNVSAINQLIKETKEEYLRQSKTHRSKTFEINGEEIIPLFDPPHLIKGIRNNLLTKNLKCTIDGSCKVAKWEHIMQLYEENPAYKGIRLIKNLTEAHINPSKIPKMKVKFAVQVFSKTVATNMGYLAEKGILPQQCQDTADILLFFDDLFDSVNGSFDNCKKQRGKQLLGPVTPKSNHSKLWEKAKQILRTMKFVNKNGREGSVPSIQNWLHTLENMEHLKNKLFNQFNFKSIWMRHFNQDPLENFFGCIRSHGGRNVNPTPSGFEAAFTSILVTNLANHSRGSNCEEDLCKAFDSMKSLFNKEDQDNIEKATEIDLEDIDCNITDFDIKKRDCRIIAQLCYVTGFVLRQTMKNIFKNCTKCKESLYNIKNPNEYLIRREYFKFKRCLTYPSEDLIRAFSEMQDIAFYILEKKSEILGIRNYCKTLIMINVNFQFVNCEEHKNNVIDFLTDITCRFFIYNWCKDVNKILNGIRSDISGNNDSIKESALNYYNKNKKRKSCHN